MSRLNFDNLASSMLTFDPSASAPSLFDLIGTTSTFDAILQQAQSAASVASSADASSLSHSSWTSPSGSASLSSSASTSTLPASSATGSSSSSESMTRATATGGSSGVTSEAVWRRDSTPHGSQSQPANQSSEPTGGDSPDQTEASAGQEELQAPDDPGSATDDKAPSDKDDGQDKPVEANEGDDVAAAAMAGIAATAVQQVVVAPNATAPSQEGEEASSDADGLDAIDAAKSPEGRNSQEPAKGAEASHASSPQTQAITAATADASAATEPKDGGQATPGPGADPQSIDSVVQAAAQMASNASAVEEAATSSQSEEASADADKTGKRSQRGENRTTTSGSGNADTPTSISDHAPATAVADVSAVAVQQAAPVAPATGDPQQGPGARGPSVSMLDGNQTISAAAKSSDAGKADVQTGSSTTTAEQGPSVAEQVDRVRFTQRVARAFESAMERGGSVRLRLSPPELGAMRLELQIRDGKMTARMETENEAARSVLLDNMPALKERLTEYKIEIERFDVTCNNQSHGETPQQSEDQSSGRSASSRGATPSEEEPAAAVSVARRPRGLNPSSGLDVVV